VKTRSFFGALGALPWDLSRGQRLLVGLPALLISPVICLAASWLAWLVSGLANPFLLVVGGFTFLGLAQGLALFVLTLTKISDHMIPDDNGP
jgi:hypothetical protein